MVGSSVIWKVFVRNLTYTLGMEREWKRKEGHRMFTIFLYGFWKAKREQRRTRVN